MMDYNELALHEVIFSENTDAGVDNNVGSINLLQLSQKHQNMPVKASTE